MKKDTKTYKMTVDLNVLEHLGINLYSNLPAVITEAVANAWDADARQVKISINTVEKEITIVDDGVGMSIEDMNDKYLRIGYRRRESGCAHTESGRPVMGRKGLGKLSLFAIADTIDVYSTPKGTKKTHGLRMSVQAIKEIANKSGVASAYHPEPLTDLKGISHVGTTIKLKEIRKKAFHVQALKRSLSRRFSVLGAKHGFEVCINDEVVKTEDRGDLSKLQFLWTLGETDIPQKQTPKLEQKIKLPSSGQSNRIIKGWIGTAEKPKDLDDKGLGVHVNNIIVHARGRLFHENILEKLNDGRLYTKYLTGQIEADFLDVDDEDDIATSDRQRIQEEDERYKWLIKELESILSKIHTSWSEWRSKKTIEKVNTDIPAVKEWIEGLQPDHQASAKKMIGDLGMLPIEQEEDRRSLIKHGILAFERMKLRGTVTEFVDGDAVCNIQRILELCAGFDSYEASLYLDIVKSRIEVIKQIELAIERNAVEEEYQNFLFQHLWLLEPGWSREVGQDPHKEKILKNIEGNGYYRVDIAYRTIAGKHVIVELKRAGRKMKLTELIEQGTKYVRALKKELKKENPQQNPAIEVVFVLGELTTEETLGEYESIDFHMNGIASGSRIVHYEKLTAEAKQSYSEFLKHSEQIDYMTKLIAELEKSRLQ